MVIKLLEAFYDKLKRDDEANSQCSDCQRGQREGTPVTHVHLDGGGFGYLEESKD